MQRSKQVTQSAYNEDSRSFITNKSKQLKQSVNDTAFHKSEKPNSSSYILGNDTTLKSAFADKELRERTIRAKVEKYSSPLRNTFQEKDQYFNESGLTPTKWSQQKAMIQQHQEKGLQQVRGRNKNLSATNSSGGLMFQNLFPVSAKNAYQGSCHKMHWVEEYNEDDSSFDSQNCNFDDDFLEEKYELEVVEDANPKPKKSKSKKKQKKVKEQEVQQRNKSNLFLPNKEQSTQLSTIKHKEQPCSDKELDIIFCKKYSRMRMEKNFQKRNEFETYKRQTRLQRIKSLKEKIQPEKKITKKAQKKCFNRLIKDSKRRHAESQDRERLSISVNKSHMSCRSQKKNNSLMKNKKLEYDYFSDFKCKRLQDERKLKEIENDLDELGKRKKLKRGPLNEYEKNLIVQRQWDYYRQKEQRKRDIEAQKEEQFKNELKTLFKPDTSLSKKSLNFSKVSKSRSKSKKDIKAEESSSSQVVVQAFDKSVNKIQNTVYDRLLKDAQRRTNRNSVQMKEALQNHLYEQQRSKATPKKKTKQVFPVKKKSLGQQRRSLVDQMITESASANLKTKKIKYAPVPPHQVQPFMTVSAQEPQYEEVKELQKTNSEYTEVDFNKRFNSDCKENGKAQYNFDESRKNSYNSHNDEAIRQQEVVTGGMFESQRTSYRTSQQTKDLIAQSTYQDVVKTKIQEYEEYENTCLKETTNLLNRDSQQSTPLIVVQKILNNPENKSPARENLVHAKQHLSSKGSQSKKALCENKTQIERELENYLEEQTKLAKERLNELREKVLKKKNSQSKKPLSSKQVEN